MATVNRARSECDAGRATSRVATACVAAHGDRHSLGLRLSSEKLYAVKVVYPIVLSGIPPPMVASHLLARHGHHAWEARILVTSISAASFFQIVITRNSNTLSVPVIALMLCSVLLTPIDTLESAAATFTGYLVLVFGLKLFNVWDVYVALVVVVSVATLSETNVIVRSRNLRQIESQTKELKRNQEELVNARETVALARLSAGLAHEFNHILEASRRAERLNAGLLSFGQQTLMSPQTLNLDDTVRTRLKELQDQLRQSTRHVFRSSHGAKIVHIDLQLFCDAMTTLVKQAGGNFKEIGTITIETSLVDLTKSDATLLPAGTCCNVAIRDGGSTKVPADRGQVFDPFYTAGEFGSGSLGPAVWVRQFGGRCSIRHHTAPYDSVGGGSSSRTIRCSVSPSSFCC